MKQKKRLKKNKFISCLFPLALFLNISCKDNNQGLLIDEWVGYGGGAILNLHEDGRFEFSIIEQNEKVGNWKMIEDSILILNYNLTNEIDTFCLVNQSTDSIFLDISTPRGLSIICFIRRNVFDYKMNNIDIWKNTLINKDWTIYRSGDSINTKFYPNGDYVVGNQKGKWNIVKNNSIGLIIFDDNSNSERSIGQIRQFQDTLFLRIYNLSRGEYYTLKLSNEKGSFSTP